MPNNIENVLLSDNHFLSNGLVFAVIVPSLFFLHSYIYDFDSVCVFYLFLVVFVMIANGVEKMKEKKQSLFFSPLFVFRRNDCLSEAGGDSESPYLIGKCAKMEGTHATTCCYL